MASFIKKTCNHCKKCGVKKLRYAFVFVPGRVAQSVTCLATDASLTADPGVASSIPYPVPYFRGD